MIDIDILESMLDYNPDTGTFHWTNFNSKNPNKGKVAGSSKGNRYVRICLFGKNYQAHRIAWAIYYGKWPDLDIDHIDGNRLNNSISNLREVNPSENNKNAAIGKNNKSGFNGVTWMKGIKRWRSRIMVNGHDLHLGFFKSKDSAIAARKKANKKYGFHENHGRKPVS